MHNLEQKVLSALDAAANGTNGGVLLAAVSGGADSTAMLAALARLREARDFKLAALHIDHSLRAEESREDAEAAAALCESLDVPCRVVTAEAGLIGNEAHRTGRGIEASARDFRHKALQDEAHRLGARFVLIAHTRDDSLENTLIRVLRGAGPAGLAVMPQIAGNILRPLLAARRAEIVEYLSWHGLSWREDSSNSDERYLRNRVRRRLVPLLDEHFPDWRTALEALARTQTLAADFLREEAHKRITWEKTGEKLSVPLECFLAESQIIREEALFEACDSISIAEDGDCPDAPSTPPAPPRRAPLRAFARNPLAENAGKKKAVTVGGIELTADGRTVSAAASRKKPLEKGASILIQKPGIYKIGSLTIECLADKTGGNYRFIVRST
jgi:tRNA(Ile)-lysidine synthase